MKKLYLIGSLRNPDIPKIASELRTALGMEIFDDWYAPGPRADDHWKEYEEARGRTYKLALKGYAARHIFDFDKHHLDTSDGTILVYPAGRSCGIEFGYMVGSGKPGWILLDEPERWDVMNQFATGVADSMDELKEMIKEWQTGIIASESSLNTLVDGLKTVRPKWDALSSALAEKLGPQATTDSQEK